MTASAVCLLNSCEITSRYPCNLRKKRRRLDRIFLTTDASFGLQRCNSNQNLPALQRPMSGYIAPGPCDLIAYLPVSRIAMIQVSLFLWTTDSFLFFAAKKKFNPFYVLVQLSGLEMLSRTYFEIEIFLHRKLPWSMLHVHVLGTHLLMHHHQY